MSSTDSTTTKDLNGVRKLRGSEDYHNWSFALRLLFKKKEEWPIVSGAEPRPLVTATSDEAAKNALTAWEKKDSSAQVSIAWTVEQNQLTHIVNKETAASMWAELKKYRDGDDIHEHISSLVNLSIELAAIDEAVPDHHLVCYILKSLPQSWDTVVLIIESLAGDNKPKSSDVIARVYAEAERRKTSPPSTTKKSNPGALVVASNGGRPNSGPRKSNVECYNCHRRGHLSRDCRQPRKERQGQDQAKASNVDDRTFVLAVQPALEVIGSPAALKAAEESPEVWIIDSGAGRHFTGRRESLVNFVEAPLSVETADGTKVVCSGYGSTDLSLANGNIVRLSKVFHLPGTRTGLVSVSTLAPLGGRVVFGDDGVATFSVKGREIARTVPGTPYHLDLANHSGSVVAASTRETQGASLMTWHRRLGHIGLDAIIELDRRGLVDGLVLSDKKKDDCEACIYAKSKRSPFKALSTPVTGYLDRLFIDLGFVDHPDHEGRTSYLAIVDQYSTAKWTFPLSSKRATEISEVFSSFKRSIETSSGRKIRRIRSDNGGEFVNSTFSTLLDEAGIVHERTAPYTPEQNGQVERLNGSIMSLVKAMLKDSGLDKSFWSLALTVATFVSNRTPHARLEGKTAFEVVTGKKPKIGHLQPFGSVAFVHVDKSLRKKLDDTVVKGVLVGYEGEANYKIFLPEEKRFVVSRHATFGRREERLLGGSPPIVPLESLDSPVNPTTESTPDRQELLPADQGTPGGGAQAAPQDGHEYVVVHNGPNPGQYEQIDPGNIIEGRRRRDNVVYGAAASAEDQVFARVTRVVDEDVPEAGSWREESVMVGVVLPDVPRNHNEAMASPERAKWRDAEDAEWIAFEEHGVLQLTKLPAGARALGTTRVVRYKARLVAQGFAQRPGIDFNETFAPVARMSTIRFLVALAASEGLSIEQFDFDTAFLNGKMTEDVYIKVPPGYPHQHGPGDVLKLIGAMYGTKQAPREWHAAVDSLMTKRGYRKSSSDVCLYIKDVDGSNVFVVLYVDDGLIVAKDKQVVDRELRALHDVYKLKRMGRVSTFLSLEFHHSAMGVWIGQPKYIKSILGRFGFDAVSRHSASTPLDDHAVVNASSPLFDDVGLYQSAVGSLQYAAQLSRPDIAAAVRAAAQKVAAPTEDDWIAVKRIFRYLSGTVDWGLVFKRGSGMDLVVYADASWADDQESRRSVGAFVVLVAGGAITWRSKQQTLIATSTAEAETLSVSDATKEVLSMRQLSFDLGVQQPASTTIFEDNTACIAIAQNPSFHGRTKHFDVVTLFIRETGGSVRNGRSAQ
ncbi:hypothetical protein JCM5296_000009 [Sporobolomyces johnsonii]